MNFFLFSSGPKVVIQGFVWAREVVSHPVISSAHFLGFKQIKLGQQDSSVGQVFAAKPSKPEFDPWGLWMWIFCKSTNT